jgi:hypothetical protein
VGAVSSQRDWRGLCVIGAGAPSPPDSAPASRLLLHAQSLVSLQATSALARRVRLPSILQAVMAAVHTHSLGVPVDPTPFDLPCRALGTAESSARESVTFGHADTLPHLVIRTQDPNPRRTDPIALRSPSRLRKTREPSPSHCTGARILAWDGVLLSTRARTSTTRSGPSRSAMVGRRNP